MADAEDLQRAVDEAITDGVRRGVLHAVAEDERLDGRTVTVGGRRLVHFGSCSYLGLETHPAMRAGVVDAVTRYGTQFSSSRAYLSSPAYGQAEEELTDLLGRPSLITPSTSMGHLAALPNLVGPRDALLLDHQVHNSVQTAATCVRAQGSAVELVPHNDLDELERRVVGASRSARRVWYAADGLYSMYADYLPLAGLTELLERHPQLWLYVDDAHGFSWTGHRGRGHVLEHASPTVLERTVVAGSLNKSFAAAGGALSFPDAQMRRRVFTVGGPLVFSGPVQPPMLGALLASFALHRGPEVVERQQHLLRLIRQFNALAVEAGLPLVSPSDAPIRCVGAGGPEVAYDLVARLRDAGVFTDAAVFPAVSAKRSGVRLTLTAHHTRDDVVHAVEALADALPAALAAEGSSLDAVQRRFARQLEGRQVRLRGAATVTPQRAHRPGLRLHRYDSISEVDAAEWDRMLGGRGSFDAAGLRTMEAAFGPGACDEDEPEHRWQFTYWIVRDPARGGAPVAATFFTTTLWKDDMLSAASLSAEVERLRAERGDPYFLTSTTVAMGTLLSEGDHLWLDRSADWRSALRLVLDAARDHEDRSGAAAVVLRDLPDGNEELHELLVAEGFLRVPVLDSWTREIDFTDEAGFLAPLRSKARQHQRANVLAWEERYRVDVVGGPAGAAPTREELDHLYRLYRDVHARKLELNVFPLPRRIMDAVTSSPGWEVFTLSLREGGPGRPVAFCVQHVGPTHVQPLFLGLDYDYVKEQHVYQQVLWQAVRSGMRHGVQRILFGMSAGLQKRRFGAVPEKRWAYVQPTETYNTDVLARLSEGVPALSR